MEDVTGQTPLEIDHINILEPKLNPLTVVVGDPDEPMEPVPVTTVQTPIPTVGVLAVIVAEFAHTV